MRAKRVAGLVVAGTLLGALASMLLHRPAGIGLSSVIVELEEPAESSSIKPVDQVAVIPPGNDRRIPAQVSDIPPRTDVKGQQPAHPRDLSRWHERENLINAGYSVERAEYLLSRAEELAEQFRQFNDGQQRDPEKYGGLLADPYFALKDEIGDAEYERFLEARKRPVAVVINSVYAGFGAEAAGLRKGDELFLYDNVRVFNGGQLNGLSRQKEDLDPSGPPVPAFVRRDGETILLMLARGHLGLNAPILAPVMTDRLPPPPPD